jgi:hypothetical protein
MKISTLQVILVTTLICQDPDCNTAKVYSFKGTTIPEGKLLPSEQAEEFIAQHYVHTGHKKFSVHNDEKTVTIYTY